jgi:PAS domain S-box-containing protein
MAQTEVEPIEQQLVDVLDSMEDAYFVMDQDFTIIRANKNFQKIAYIPREEALGRNLWEVFPYAAEPDSPYWINYNKVMKNRKPASFRNYNTHKDWVQISVYPTTSGGICVFSRNVTEKVLAEEALRESEKRFRALVSAASNVVYRLSPDWSEMCELEGMGFLESTGKVEKDWIHKYIPKHEQTRVEAAIAQAIENREIFELEHQVYQADGTIGWALSRAIPIFDEEGNISEWFGAATDITQKVKADEDRRRRKDAEHRSELLTEQRNALLKISQTKDEFVSLASHQLRTPATAVKQFIGMLMDGFAGKLTPEQERMVRSAYESNERELKIISDLLKTAQLDSDISKLATGKYDIINLLQDVMDDLIPTLQQRSQKIKFKHQGKGTKLIMDSTEMKLAFSNLIENASKYSPEGSAITVQVTEVDSNIEVSVSDNGVGINKENYDRIFEKFTRITNELTESVAGSGLGLYWVKQIAHMHGGDVLLESTPGKGSTFTMRLPKSIK